MTNKPQLPAATTLNQPTWKRVFAMPSVRALIALMLIFSLGMVFSGNGAFYKWSTHRDMLRGYSVYGILACGMTLVIITGGIDLAVGSVLGLVAVVFALLSIHMEWHPVPAILASLVVGTLAGLTSGGLVAKFRIQPFIATLAMMVFARGLAKTISGGKKISTVIPLEDGGFRSAELPAIFNFLDSRVLGGHVPVVTLVFVACLLISGVILWKLRVGRYLYAVGGNEEASRLSGVPVAGTKIFAYAMSGLFAAIAGMCQAAQEYHGDPETGATYELSAIAIVVIGGTNLMGGRGGIMLTLLGTLTIGYLEKIMSINAGTTVFGVTLTLGEPSRLMLTGMIIIAAVLLQRSRGR